MRLVRNFEKRNHNLTIKYSQLKKSQTYHVWTFSPQYHVNNSAKSECTELVALFTFSYRWYRSKKGALAIKFLQVLKSAESKNHVVRSWSVCMCVCLCVYYQYNWKTSFNRKTKFKFLNEYHKGILNETLWKDRT